MAVDAAAVARVRDVLDVCVERLAEEFLGVLGLGVGIGHGGAEGDALVRHGAARLGAALLEAPRRGRLVRRAVLAVELVVRELDHHLHVGIGRALELLDQPLAVRLVGLDAQLVRADLRLEVGLGGGDVAFQLGGEGEAQGDGGREVGAHGGVVEGEGVGEDLLVGEVVEAVGGGAVHHRVLAHEARGAVVVDDELERLVEPAVGAVAVPVLVGAFLERDRGGVVEADDERGGFDGVDRRGVCGGGSAQLGVYVGPDVAVLRGQGADRGRALGGVVDALELELELGGGELLSVELVRDGPELVLADDEDVRVALEGVLDGGVGGLLRHAAAVEHVLVRGHGHGQLLHVLWLEGALVDHGLEGEDGGGHGGCALGRVPALLVVAVRVEVAHVGDDGVPVAHVGGLVPPFRDPVARVGVLSARDQALLEGLAWAAGCDEVVYGFCGGLVFRGGEQRVDGFEVPLCRLLEGGDGQTGEGVLEAQHGAFGVVLLVSYTCGEGGQLVRGWREGKELRTRWQRRLMPSRSCRSHGCDLYNSPSACCSNVRFSRLEIKLVTHLWNLCGYKWSAEKRGRTRPGSCTEHLQRG